MAFVAAIAEAVNVTVDAVTLNNALNVAQLVVLIALVKWVRGE